MEKLTAREEEVFALLGEGLTVKEIGRGLHISRSTVNNHCRSLFLKRGCDNLFDLRMLAWQERIEKNGQNDHRSELAVVEE